MSDIPPFCAALENTHVPLTHCSGPVHWLGDDEDERGWTSLRINSGLAHAGVRRLWIVGSQGHVSGTVCSAGICASTIIEMPNKESTAHSTLLCIVTPDVRSEFGREMVCCCPAARSLVMFGLCATMYLTDMHLNIVRIHSRNSGTWTRFSQITRKILVCIIRCREY